MERLLLASVRRRLASSSSLLYLRLQATMEQAGVGKAGMAHTHARHARHCRAWTWAWSMAAWQNEAWQSMGICQDTRAEHGHARAGPLWTAGHKKRHTEHVAPCSRAGKDHLYTRAVIVVQCNLQTQVESWLDDCTGCGWAGVQRTSVSEAVARRASAKVWPSAPMKVPTQINLYGPDKRRHTCDKGSNELTRECSGKASHSKACVHGLDFSVPTLARPSLAAIAGASAVASCPLDQICCCSDQATHRLSSVSDKGGHRREGQGGWERWA